MTRGKAAQWATGVVVSGLVVVPFMVVETATVAGAAESVSSCSGSASVVGSLPYEVERARPAGKIRVSVSCPATSPIDIGAPMAVDTNLTIAGPGSESLVIRGEGTTGVFAVSLAGTLDLSGMTVEGGNAGGGGGVDNDGTLTVTDSTFSGNSASYGGGVENDGTLTLTDSTFIGNSAAFGAGLLNFGTASVNDSTFSGNGATEAGGAILNEGTLTIGVSTLSGNTVSTAGGDGGGIFNGSSLLLTSSTLSGNRATAGGGIFNGGTATLAGTIVAASRSGDCSGTVTDDGYNLSDDRTCGFTAGAHSLSGIDPELGPLADNGGPTETLLPGTTSPAVDQIPTDTFVDGAVLCPGADQRGVARPQSVDCAIGSVEPVQPQAITSPDRATATAGSPFSFTVITSGTPVPKISRTGILPQGIVFSNQFRTALLYGTPRPKTPGVYPITLTATFGSGAASHVVTQAFTLTVASP